MAIVEFIGQVLGIAALMLMATNQVRYYLIKYQEYKEEQAALKEVKTEG